VFPARWAAAVAAARLVAAGCTAARRVERGVYHSSKGYRVAVPGPAWRVVSGEADLDLEHRAAPARLAVNATCGGVVARRGQDVLERQLLAGLGDRTVLERAGAEVGGRAASRVVAEGAGAAEGGRVRVEAYVMRDGRCVYDLIYAAPADRFPAWRGDFARFVGSFALE
jgi:hypothetical protein